MAAEPVQFCLSEVKLGLIPATISPYVIRAMGARAAHRWFLTAERFAAAEAHRIGFVHEVVPATQLDARVAEIAQALVSAGPAAVKACKQLVHDVAGREIGAGLIAAHRRAHRRHPRQRRGPRRRAVLPGQAQAELAAGETERMDALAPPAVDTPQLLALAAALGWASGFRLYAAVFLTGLAGFMGWVELPPGLQVLQHPAVLGASGFMLFVEFFADKIPVRRLDVGRGAHADPHSGRRGAGRRCAGRRQHRHGLDRRAGRRRPGGHQPCHQDDHARGGQHLARAVLQRGVSLFEDGWVLFLLWLSATHPVIFTVVLVASVLAAVLLLVVLIKFLRAVVRGLRDFFAGRRMPPAALRKPCSRRS